MSGVTFACMPWATTTRPSLALGILTELCARRDVPSRVLYPNMDMVAAIGYRTSSRFANERMLYGLSEHLFACDIFGRDDLNSDEYLHAIASLDLPDRFTDEGYLRWLRDEAVPTFMQRTTDRVLGTDPEVVGVSSTFNQVMASLALCARVKKAAPAITTIAGGACFDGEMGEEYQRALPHVLDHVFLGEAENSFDEFLRRRSLGEPTAGIPGVTWYADGAAHVLPGKPLEDMNASPMPNYDAFFAEATRLRDETGHVFNIEYLPFESSRGCWWGQKQHCVFCGINDDLMRFREKDPERVVHEMITLTSRYRAMKLTASDWIISKKSRRVIWGLLKDLDLDIETFYETRADLSKEEFALMRDAGVLTIQPGIESLSSELLAHMRKGTTRIRHVQFLRWAREYGIHASYNILAGFPGEQAGWYQEMSAFLPRVIHLQPPHGNINYVEMHRFSPLFQQRSAFDVDELQLREDYACNFPPGLLDTLKVGYFFTYHSETLAERGGYEGPLRAALKTWLDAHESSDPPGFEYRIGAGFTVVDDTRGHRASRRLTLAGLHQDVLLLCDTIQSRAALRRLLTPVHGHRVVEEQLDAVVDDLVAADILMTEGRLLLTLPVGRRPRTTTALYEYVLGTAKPSPAAPRQLPLLALSPS